MTGLSNPAIRRLVRRELGQNKARAAALFLLTFLPVLFVGYVATLVHTEAGESNADEVFGQADAIARTSLPLTGPSPAWPGSPRVVSWIEWWSGDLATLTTDADLGDPLLTGYDWGGASELVVVAPGSLSGADLGGDAVAVALLDWDGAIPDEVSTVEFLTGNSQTYLDTRAAWVQLERDNNPSSTVLAGLFMVGLSIATGAISYAAWGSSIRRRLHDVGLLSASGGEPRHAASVQGGQALLISAAGSAAAMLTLIIAGSNTTIVTRVTSPGVSASEIRWPVAGLLLPALIAVAVATAAGWWPARETARMPLAALLSGRRVAATAVPGSPVLGLALMAGGLAALGSSTTADTSSRMITTGGLGLVALAVGALPVLAALFRRLGSDTIGRSLPVTLRFVVRDASRHAGRSAATVLGVGAIVAAVWLGTVDQMQEQRTAADTPLLLLIGFVVAAVVIGLVTAMAASEVRDDLAAISLIGIGPRFRARFLGLQALVASGVGVAAGLAVGTMIRFVVDDELPIPWDALLALVSLPFVFGLCVMALQSLPVARSATTISR